MHKEALSMSKKSFSEVFNSVRDLHVRELPGESYVVDGLKGLLETARASEDLSLNFYQWDNHYKVAWFKLHLSGQRTEHLCGLQLVMGRGFNPENARFVVFEGTQNQGAGYKLAERSSHEALLTAMVEHAARTTAGELNNARVANRVITR
jgi:hypothetical protein